MMDDGDGRRGEGGWVVSPSREMRHLSLPRRGERFFKFSQVPRLYSAFFLILRKIFEKSGSLSFSSTF